MSHIDKWQAASQLLQCISDIRVREMVELASDACAFLEEYTTSDRHDGRYQSALHAREELRECKDRLNLLKLAVCKCDLQVPSEEAMEITQYMERTYPYIPKDIEEERAILAELLAVPSQDGSYLEVGAWRPQEQSNSWQFYEHGWRGLLIEPIPQAWPALLAQRPGDMLCPFAVSDKSGYAHIWANGPTSSFRPDKNLEDTCRIIVETRTLEDILAMYWPYANERVDLCTIDVEGWEDKVFAGVNWKTFDPCVLMVECLDDNTNWRQVVADHGYAEEARTEKNLIMVKR